MNLSGGWSFRLFNFPVRVHYSFFLIAILLGLRINNLILLALWVAIVFFSVLLHELGHAVVSEYYGRSPRIELYQMGGVTISARHSLLSYPKEILINLAGALAGFLFAGLLFGIMRVTGPIQQPYLNFIVGQLLWVNVGWGIINLIPMLPLDGGNIMRNLYHWLRNPYDERTPLLISVVFGVAAIIAALVLLRSLYLALLLAFLTFRNFMMLRGGYMGGPFLI